MALINMGAIPKQIITLLNKNIHGVELLTYKRNRGITITKDERCLLHVSERGYHEEQWVIDQTSLPKLLKTLLKREFPRSRKARLYQLKSPEEFNLAQQRKKI
jgi:hypothetical protein